MNAADVLQTIGWKDGSITLMAHLKGQSGVAVTQASLTGLTVMVYDSAQDWAQVTPTIAPVVSAVIFDALQTVDPRWTVNTTGYNFLYTVPASYFAGAPRTYRIKVTFTPVTGDAFFFVVNHSTNDPSRGR